MKNGEIKIGDVVWKRMRAGGGLFNGPIIRVTEIRPGQVYETIFGIVLEQRDGPWSVGSEFLANPSEFRKPENFETEPT